MIFISQDKKQSHQKKRQCIFPKKQRIGMKGLTEKRQKTSNSVMLSIIYTSTPHSQSLTFCGYVISA